MRTLEEKKLLVNAICEYAPYEPLIANEDIDSGFPIRIHLGHLGLSRYIEGYSLDGEIYGEYKADKTVIYLRPMDSMTEEDNLALSKYIGCSIRTQYGEIYFPNIEDNTLCKWEKVFDWLREHLFDYRGLIKKGIAKPIGTEERWVSTETLKEIAENIQNTIEEVKKIQENGQKKSRRNKK
jgi:hypothetical protein